MVVVGIPIPLVIMMMMTMVGRRAAPGEHERHLIADEHHVTSA